MSTDAGYLTAVSVRDCCPPSPNPLSSRLCIPLYTVVQAIINLASPCGSSEYQILSQVPNICPAMSVGPTQVAAALAEGVHRKVLCAKALCTPELRYFVNQDMNRYGTNEDIYNAFKSQLYCPGTCTPCPNCPCTGPCCVRNSC